MSLNIKSVLIWLLALIAATIIGNSTWDWIFKPSIIWFFNHIVEIINTFQVNYIDEIYEKGMKEEIRLTEAKIYFSLRLCIILLFMIIFYLIEIKTKEIELIENPLFRKYRLPVVFIIFIVTSSNIVFNAYKTVKSAQLYEYTYRLIETNRPVMKESDYIKIRAEMLKVDSQEKYFDIIRMLANSSSRVKIIPLE